MNFRQSFRLKGFPTLAAICALASPLAGSPAAAQGLGWMKGSAAGFFTAADWQMLRQAVDEAFSEARDGEPREWRNDKSGAHGTVTPLFTDTRDDVTCRRVRIESSARGASDSFRYLFCREGEGRWILGLPGHGNLTLP